MQHITVFDREGFFCDVALEGLVLLGLADGGRRGRRPEERERKRAHGGGALQSRPHSRHDGRVRRRAVPVHGAGNEKQLTVACGRTEQFECPCSWLGWASPLSVLLEAEHQGALGPIREEAPPQGKRFAIFVLLVRFNKVNQPVLSGGSVKKKVRDSVGALRTPKKLSV